MQGQFHIPWNILALLPLPASFPWSRNLDQYILTFGQIKSGNCALFNAIVQPIKAAHKLPQLNTIREDQIISNYENKGLESHVSRGRLYTADRRDVLGNTSPAAREISQERGFSKGIRSLSFRFIYLEWYHNLHLHTFSWAWLPIIRKMLNKMWNFTRVDIILR